MNLQLNNFHFLSIQLHTKIITQNTLINISARVKSDAEIAHGEYILVYTSTWPSA